MVHGTTLKRVATRYSRQAMEISHLSRRLFALTDNKIACFQVGGFDDDILALLDLRDQQLALIVLAIGAKFNRTIKRAERRFSQRLTDLLRLYRSSLSID